MALSYREQMNHPLWIRKRQQILDRDGHSCTICGSDIHRLEVHHLCYYSDLLAWEYDDELMVSVCGKHHEQLHELHKATGLIAFQCLRGNIDLTTLNETLLNLKNVTNGNR